MDSRLPPARGDVRLMISVQRVANRTLPVPKNLAHLDGVGISAKEFDQKLWNVRVLAVKLLEIGHAVAGALSQSDRTGNYRLPVLEWVRFANRAADDGRPPERPFLLRLRT